MKDFLADIGIQVGAVIMLATNLVVVVLAATKFLPSSPFF